MGQIEELERELSTLRFQVSQIQNRLDQASNTIEELKRQQGVAPQMQTQLYQPQARTVAQPIYQQAPQQQPQPQVRTTVQPHPQLYQAPVRNSSTESWIGKHLMGVLASILIFIALVLFASLIIPYMNDGVKITMMFAVSIGLSIGAYFQHVKKPENTFFTALLACCLGCTYLSVLVTRIHFEVINDLFMYILLFIWAAVVLIIGRKESRLFQAIGDAGFVISAFLGAGIKDTALVIPMLFYLCILGGAFQYTFWKNKTQRLIQSCINLGIIFYFAVVIGDKISIGVPLTIAAIILMLISAGYYAYFLFGNLLTEDADNTFMAFGSAIALASSYMLFGDCVNTVKWLDIIVFFAIVVVAEAALLMGIAKSDKPYVRSFNIAWTTGWIIVGLIRICFNYEEFFDTGIIFVALLAVALYGIRRDIKGFRNQAAILAAAMIILELIGNSSVLFYGAAFIFAVVVFIFEAFVVNKYALSKIIFYVMTQVCMGLFLCTALEDSLAKFVELRELLVIATMGIFNAAMIFLKLDHDSAGNKDKQISTVLNIFNVIGMLVGLYNIENVDSPVLQGLYIVFTVALACINLPRHFASGGSEKLYTGIKFGIILLVSLFGYDAEGFVVSVAILLFAIVCIAVGFNKTFGAKELRLYGLILSMICVAKFIMIDITYENTIGRAISFLVSGILCFGISAIYNHFEKQGNTVNNEK